MKIDYQKARHRMVETQLKARGITDERVLQAFGKIARHEFVDPGLEAQAYSDRALPIGHGQTISQPYMVAIMTQSLKPQPQDRVLEVGTGSGYQGAILSVLVRSVYTIERLEPLARRSGEIFTREGLTNIVQQIGDGSIGWALHAPYDGIIVTAGSPRVPPQLLDQLADGGRLVIPTGSSSSQVLKIVTREGNSFRTETSIPCIFVPLLGKEGWNSD